MKSNFLNLRCRASSVIEVVIAMTIIAVLITLSGRLYVSLNNSTKTLQEINDQGLSMTKFINQIFILEEEIRIEEELQFSEMTIKEIKESDWNKQLIEVYSIRNKKLWQIELYTEK